MVEEAQPPPDSPDVYAIQIIIIGEIIIYQIIKEQINSLSDMGQYFNICNPL